MRPAAAYAAVVRYAKSRKVPRKELVGEHVHPALRGSNLALDLVRIRDRFGANDPDLRRWATEALTTGGFGRHDYPGPGDVFERIRDKLAVHAQDDAEYAYKTGDHKRPAYYSSLDPENDPEGYRKEAKRLGTGYNWHRIYPQLGIDHVVGRYLDRVHDELKKRNGGHAVFDGSDPYRRRLMINAFLYGKIRVGGKTDGEIAVPREARERFWAGLKTHVDKFGFSGKLTSLDHLAKSLRRVGEAEEGTERLAGKRSGLSDHLFPATEAAHSVDSIGRIRVNPMARSNQYGREGDVDRYGLFGGVRPVAGVRFHSEVGGRHNAATHAYATAEKSAAIQALHETGGLPQRRAGESESSHAGRVRDHVVRSLANARLFVADNPDHEVARRYLSAADRMAGTKPAEVFRPLTQRTINEPGEGRAVPGSAVGDLVEPMKHLIRAAHDYAGLKAANQKLDRTFDHHLSHPLAFADERFPGLVGYKTDADANDVLDLADPGVEMPDHPDPEVAAHEFVNRLDEKQEQEDREGSVVEPDGAAAAEEGGGATDDLDEPLDIDWSAVTPPHDDDSSFTLSDEPEPEPEGTDDADEPDPEPASPPAAAEEADGDGPPEDSAPHHPFVTPEDIDGDVERMLKRVAEHLESKKAPDKRVVEKGDKGKGTKPKVVKGAQRPIRLDPKLPGRKKNKLPPLKKPSDGGTRLMKPDDGKPLTFRRLLERWVRRFNRQHEEAFHRAIHEREADRNNALVYADWLRENGRPSQASLTAHHAGRFGDSGTVFRPHEESFRADKLVRIFPADGGKYRVHLRQRLIHDPGLDHTVMGTFDRGGAAEMVSGLTAEGGVVHPQDRRYLDELFHHDEPDADEIDHNRPTRHAAYKAPAGGMVVGNLFYGGGQVVPSLSDERPARKGRRKKRSRLHRILRRVKPLVVDYTQPSESPSEAAEG